ncbi:YjbH domain-containing protein [Chachezhania sediminis]|uniref:YjbH domain-containing protein n=1 Tax=Chachezhania sediminis TaxID=2599291 RepID=UPI001E421565|nr:YjbH domain-containing protein [Chachezhania sediminis]
MAAVAMSSALPDTGAADPVTWARPTLSFMGVPGVIDMPSAHQMEEGDLSFAFNSIGSDIQRITLAFQFTPRFSGVFRYGRIYNFFDNDAGFYDRSFDLRYMLAEEGQFAPAVTVGLQDIGGTGIYASEYLVAAKTFGRLRATAGMGWGRLGSYDGFSNPLGVFGNYFKTRPGQTGGINQTGRLDAGSWFRGDAAVFGGLEYRYSNKLSFSAEYSSDAYSQEQSRIDFKHRSPLNFAVNYRLSDDFDVRAAYLYGSEVGIQLSYVFNAKRPLKYEGGLDNAPVPVRVRPAGSARDLGWTLQPEARSTYEKAIDAALTAEGFTFEALKLEPHVAYLRFRMGSTFYTAQAVGRISRIMTQVLPDSIDKFVIVPVSFWGQPASQVVINRSDIEELEFAPDGAWETFARAQIRDIFQSDVDLQFPTNTFPSFDWGVSPYLSMAFFDPDNPLRVDFGIQASARYEPSEGVVLFGQLQAKLLGNQSDLPPSNSEIQHVRSDYNLYAQQGEVAMTELTAAKYFRPGENIYGRVTGGYLEPMYAGISGEVLWKPVDSRVAFGAELNYVQQRDYNQRFGLLDYKVATGFLSAYLEGTKGFYYELDVGRYLAGDWGATLSIDRVFDNGIRVGAFATLTDVPFDQFGEGSFDKGIVVDIPFATIFGRSSDQTLNRTIRPVLRDGGAQLDVSGRLFESVRKFHQPGLERDWGRFWR